jgi:hypothetical protein
MSEIQGLVGVCVNRIGKVAGSVPREECCGLDILGMYGAVIEMRCGLHVDIEVDPGFRTIG